MITFDVPSVGKITEHGFSSFELIGFPERGQIVAWLYERGGLETRPEAEMEYAGLRLRDLANNCASLVDRRWICPRNGLAILQCWFLDVWATYRQ